MPKDATKNIDRYKIRGGQLNEFEFHQSQEEYADQPKTQASNLIPGTPPEERAEGLRPATRKAPAKKSAAKARKEVKATKATKNTKSRTASPRGATAKKLAARKAAKKARKPAKKR